MLQQAQYELPAASYECDIREGGDGDPTYMHATFLFNCTQFMLARTVGEPL